MRLLLQTAVLLLIPAVAQAHFPWMHVTSDGRVDYFFGEGLGDQTYKLPPAVAKAEIKQADGDQITKVPTEAIDSEKFVGLRSKGSVSPEANLMSQVTFGIYHGSKLEYYTQYLGRNLPKSFADCKPLPMDLQAHVVDTDGGVDVYVLWKGKPLADADVKLFCSDGHEEGNAKTDAAGKVSFDDKQVEEGINAIMVGKTIADEAGKLGDKEYKSAAHYLTATFYDPQDK